MGGEFPRLLERNGEKRERSSVNEFENKVAIVTGTTGIGRAIAQRLVSGGASVTACGIDEAANHELLQESYSSGHELRV